VVSANCVAAPIVGVIVCVTEVRDPLAKVSV